MIDHRTNFLLVAMAGALLALAGCAGETVMPTTYNTYDAKDGSFQIEYPAGWEVTAGGSNGYPWVKFTSGSAQVMVDANIAGSLMGDIAKLAGPTVVVEGGENAPPVEKIHASEKDAFVQEMGVTEGDPAFVVTRFGGSRKSEFTGTGVLGDAFHGYRVTALSRDKRIRVVCRCSESQWQALQPAFDKMIGTLAMGAGAF
jgi:hypothetical protein